MRSSIEFILALSLLLAGLTGCGGSENTSPAPHIPPNPLFTLLPGRETGISFANRLTEGPNTNILVYEYFYNGGGVAAGDLNGDGHTDLYFTANMAENKLFLGDGRLHFQDITQVSGAGGRPGPWKTGVSFVDINADGRLDIYVCYSGMLPVDKRRNQLFINRGNTPEGIPQFVDEAADYGLDSPAFSNQGYFFDYDGDGDLDCLLLNHNPKALPLLNVTKTQQLLKKADVDRGLRLYQNNDLKFTDVTEAAGINGSELSYGLGLALSDLDGDGDPDFYVSNDYEVPDYLYTNNGDGTFTDRLGEYIGHTSHFSMGSDVADVDHDGRPDIYTLDMLPESHYRRQLLTPDDNQSKLEQNLANGFHHQTMRNMLHLNRGEAGYAEVGRLAGVATTDWSWSALFADFDQDGYQDLHVTNGYVRDYTDQDFIKYMEDYVARKGRLVRKDLREIIAEMPASDVSNYLFRGRANAQFSNRTKDWGLQRPSNSTGAAYADLDEDGDLDLIVNNINQPAFIYRNDQVGNHSLRVRLVGSEENTRAIGAKVRLTHRGSMQTRELFPNRGYLSSVSPVLHFGLGAQNGSPVEKLEVSWPDGRFTSITAVNPDSLLVLRHVDAEASGAATVSQSTAAPIFKEVPSPLKHADDAIGIRDFDRQRLLPRNLSSAGPELRLRNGKVEVVPAELSSQLRRTARSADGRYEFVGGGPAPGRYPEATASILRFRLEGESYEDRTGQLAPELSDIGMVSDAIWADLNSDGREELIVVGEYLPVTIFGWVGEQLEAQTSQYLDTSPSGWWNAIATPDLNGDGQADLVLGNQGLNNLFEASPEEPITLYYGDMDANGSVDPFLTYFIDGKEQLDATRDETLGQLAPLRNRFVSYASYAAADPRDVLSSFDDRVSRLRATELRSCLYLSRPDGRYELVALPLEAQYAPVHTITPLDYDGDGDIDLLLCGNESQAKQRWGRSDANAGCLLRNEGGGVFAYVPQQESGLALRGDVRSVVRQGDIFYFGIHGGPVTSYRLPSELSR